MKRKLLSACLALVLTVCLSLSASAACRGSVYGPMTIWRTADSASACCPTACVPEVCEPSAKQSEPEAPTQPQAPTVPIREEQPTQPEKTETPVAPAVGSAYERRVVELVNAERAAYGLHTLGMSQTLSDGARLKSQDLHDNRYFDHTSPTYGSPFEMMRRFGIIYSYAGENIAMGYSTPEAVVRAWMQSPGHRANILSAGFTSIGVGYVADGGYWTQWFLG